MKTYPHRIAQILSALAAAGSGGTVVVTDPTDVNGWMLLIVGAVVGVVTLYRQISDPTTPTLPSKGPVILPPPSAPSQ